MRVVFYEDEGQQAEIIAWVRRNGLAEVHQTPFFQQVFVYLVADAALLFRLVWDET